MGSLSKKRAQTSLFLSVLTQRFKQNKGREREYWNIKDSFLPMCDAEGHKGNEIESFW